MTVVVVGAGVAGLACARALAGAGVPVRVLERGRVPGGRLASKRFDGRPADIGAAYLTVDDERFAAVVRRWHAAGLAREWTDTMLAFPGGPPAEPRTGPVRWAAPGGLRSLAEDLAQGLDVRLGHTVARVGPGPVVDGEPADAVVLAMPGPQAARLLEPGGPVAGAAAAQTWHPVLSAVLRYPARDWAPFAGAFVNDHPVLATVCDDGDRRGDGAPVLVAHTTGAVAAAHLTDPAAAGPLIEDAVRDLLGLGAPAQLVHVHRWTYAQPDPGDGGHLLDDTLVGLAGDAFGRPRVQTAWLSGHTLGGELARRLAAG
ncbi:putative NAD/FAD-dependent oxidoreductase [Spirilliplanes yamanashiensis]|nr:putative NAD/FAD-dependent oxidoreductase [Spirilliplanes yamanashiensis]